MRPLKISTKLSDSQYADTKASHTGAGVWLRCVRVGSGLPVVMARCSGSSKMRLCGVRQSRQQAESRPKPSASLSVWALLSPRWKEAARASQGTDQPGAGGERQEPGAWLRRQHLQPGRTRPWAHQAEACQPGSGPSSCCPYRFVLIGNLWGQVCHEEEGPRRCR